MTELKQTIRYCKAPDGRAIAWAQMGRGPTVLMINALGVSDDHFNSPLHVMYRAFYERFTVVRFDFRGTGLSDRSSEEVAFENTLEDLEAVIRAAELDAFAILSNVGASQTAIEGAARYPERVRCLGLHGGFARGLMHRHPTLEQVAQREVIYAAMMHGWDDPAFRLLHFRQLEPDASVELQQWYADRFHSFLSPGVFVNWMRMQSQTDVSESAQRIRCPTLMVHARGDPRIPFSEAVRLATLIPQAQLVPVNSRNNFILPSEPGNAGVWTQMVDFFATHLGAGADTTTALPDLTPRERQVLELIAQGKDNLQIAAHLSLSEKTVRNHITPIFDKLQVENRSQAIVKAREAGLGKGKPEA